jgi:hypothetical protein
VTLLQPGDIVDDGSGSGLDAAMIAINRLVPTDRGVFEACGVLFGHEGLDIFPRICSSRFSRR